jgi:outer membrane receptor protein involved in Fe transport
LTLPALILATCLVQGTVLDTSNEPVIGAAVLQAATGDTLALTDAAGHFVVEAPERAPGETVLEFRHPEHFGIVERGKCDRGDVLVRMVPRVYALEIVEISATRLTRPWEASPVREEQIPPEALRDSEGAGPSLAQAVQQLPGIGAIGRDGYTSAPTVRGLGRDRSLILVEGMRMSSDRGVGPTATFLDPVLLRELSIVRGASGVAYGSGAIGGVISTGLGPISGEPSVTGHVGGSSNDRSFLAAGLVEGPAGDAWRAAGGAYYRTRDDYEYPAGDGFGAGRATNSGMTAGGGALILARDLGGGRLRISALGAGAVDVGRPTTRTDRLDTITDETHLLATTRWTKSDGNRRTELGFGWHRPRSVNGTERFDGGGGRTRTGAVTNDSNDLSLSALMERPLRGGGLGHWLAGADWFGRIGTDAVETNQPWLAGIPGPVTTTVLVADASRHDLGFFLGWKRGLRQLGEVLVAARLDAASRGADGQPDADWISPSFTAGAVLPVVEKWAVTAQVNRSFRAPRIQELYFEGDRPGGSRLANPDLEPETAWSGELGARFAAGPWSADGSVWGMLAKDLIVQLPVDAAGDTLRNFNEDEGRLFGVELSLRWNDPDDRARASLEYAYIRGENEDGVALPDIPSGEIRLAGDGRVWSFDEARDVRVRGALRAGAAKLPVPGGGDERWYSPLLGPTDIGGDERGHPGYARFDVGVRMQPWETTALDVALVNLFDSSYLDRAEADAFPQPGRSLRIEIIWR